jgi:hydrogenase expression/formation protein HypE
MHKLLEDTILPAINNAHLATRHDATVVQIGRTKLAMTTDSYVVKPLFFPGGDIGSLAVNGTVNDLAMAGAKPLYLSLGLIIEEGFATETLAKIMDSIRQAAKAAGVEVITGDTKVVDRGKGDGIFINTAGIGIIEHELIIAPSSVRAGDLIVISGDVGRHGIAIMAQREGLQFETTIESDCAPLNRMVQSLIDAKVEIHCLRDLTRGGLASALVEIAESSKLGIQIREAVIPVDEQVRGACELLGLDPLYVANEGRCVVFVPAKEKLEVMELLKASGDGKRSAIIGEVAEENPGMVTMVSTIGATRIVDMLSGEQMPRIC